METHNPLQKEKNELLAQLDIDDKQNVESSSDSSNEIFSKKEVDKGQMLSKTTRSVSFRK